jgi:hypothetical protein
MFESLCEVTEKQFSFSKEIERAKKGKKINDAKTEFYCDFIARLCRI